jgi:micrococcal nuclease
LEKAVLFAGPLRPSQLYNYTVTVEKIIDGDTLDIIIHLGFKISLRERVRLAGIDTKEIFGPRAEPAGQTSKQFTTDWVGKAKQVTLSVKQFAPDVTREKYGRVLGAFYRDNDPTSLNDALIEAGLARPAPASWGLEGPSSW